MDLQSEHYSRPPRSVPTEPVVNLSRQQLTGCRLPAPWTTDRMALASHAARATQRAPLLRAIPARVNTQHGQRIMRKNMSSSSGGHGGPKSSNDTPWIVSITYY
jgi:hypothetical protein